MNSNQEQVQAVCRQEAEVLKDQCRKLASYLLKEAKDVPELQLTLSEIEETETDDESLLLMGLWSMVALDPDLKETIEAVLTVL